MEQNSETKKFSTESFLTFRELLPIVSYRRVSYNEKYAQFHSVASFITIFSLNSNSGSCSILNFAAATTCSGYIKVTEMR